jgi:antitoxin ParD1/3/4
MYMSLTSELEEAVKSKVASGLYNNASEVVREALRQSLIRERENQWIVRESAIGFTQLETGPKAVASFSSAPGTMLWKSSAFSTPRWISSGTCRLKFRER